MLDEGMRAGTEKEFNRIMHYGRDVKRMITKRSQDVIYKDRGTEVASKHISYMRGKVSSTSYMVNPDYLKGRKR